MSVFLSSGLPTRKRRDAIAQFADHGGKNSFLDEQARAGAANVALVEIDSGDDAFDGLVDRRVLENDVGRFAAQLERQLLFRSRDCLGENFADRRSNR